MVLDFEKVKHDFIKAIGIEVSDVIEDLLRKFGIASGYEDVLSYIILLYAEDKITQDWLRELVEGARAMQLAQLLKKFGINVSEWIKGFIARR